MAALLIVLAAAIAALVGTRLYRPAPAAPGLGGPAAPADANAPAVPEPPPGEPAAASSTLLDRPGAMESLAPGASLPVTASPPAPESSASSAAPTSLEDVIGASLPAVVSIEVGNARGSGFFAAPHLVVTNAHVVAGAVSVTVRLPAGTAVPGRVETSSSEFDLAIVRVDASPPNQPVLPLGSVAAVRPGQEVVAVGLALGVFQNTVTRGIISAVRRAGQTVLLQTDAAINPGNSGGPLLNRSGQVVGITTLKVTGSADSLGFAVAVDHARALLAGAPQTDPLPAATSPAPSAPLAQAFTGRSTADEMRQQGVEGYEKTLAALARRGAEIDDYWSRIRRSCSVRVSAGYDREWFGIWDARVTLTDSDPSCAAAFRDVTQLAADVRGALAAAHEAARRTGVYPGTLRDIRRRYRMDWQGWDR
jgi:S1-C subfamily serine protease